MDSGARTKIILIVEGVRRPSCDAHSRRVTTTPLSLPLSRGNRTPETPKAASVSRAAFACVVERLMRLPPQVMASGFAALLLVSAHLHDRTQTVAVVLVDQLASAFVRAWADMAKPWFIG